MAFTHLHVHTEYSLLDGSNKIAEYVNRVKELGMNSAAITDHGVMYGVIDFYKACKAAGIKPILGCEVYVAPGSRFDKTQNTGSKHNTGTNAANDDRYYHLILLAENNQGYANLMKIVSRSFTEGYYYKPRVDDDLLREFHEGIIASSACLAGEVARNIVRDNLPAAEAAALKYKEIFGAGNYFLELQDHGYADQQKVNRALLQMSRKLDIPLIATNDVHYTYDDDVEAHDILLCIQTGKKLSDENRMRYPGGQFFVKSEAEMRELFPYAPEALDNTQAIADRCNVEIEFGVTKLPHFDVPEGYDSWTYLNKLCEDGLRERYPQVAVAASTEQGAEQGAAQTTAARASETSPAALRERMQYELQTIRQMGYVDYFLIVWDYINYSRRHGIMVGPGRGSAAGSIVAYCLHITDIDPIKYSLLFERFLNPERVSMPDIDVDFCFERRGEVIDYVTSKYGTDKVTQIITFGTLAAKGVIRDVGRVMDLPYGFVDSISKMVPAELNMTLDKALVQNPELRKAYEEDDRIHKLIDMSRRLEGLPRHSSVHAAGVVICSEPAEDLVPLARAADGSVTTQFTMTTIEELGLLKMDFLGLRTLTVIQNAVEMANQNRSTEAAYAPAGAAMPSTGAGTVLPAEGAAAVAAATPGAITAQAAAGTTPGAGAVQAAAETTSDTITAQAVAGATTVAAAIPGAITAQAAAGTTPSAGTMTAAPAPAPARRDPIGFPIDLSRLDYADPAVYASLCTGHTEGVFQLESGGMQNFMKELRPENFEDVIAGISLYRPGPMDFIPRYIAGKKNPALITYETPELQPILEATYGCIVYQEQVMQIVRDLGGYTLGRSDLVRRAMSKKKQKVMEQERRNFIYGNAEEGVPGCVARGISAEKASHIYDTMMDFAKYAFNKSHAACYAVVAYQTAWLKYYYPTEFMAALMTSVIDFPTKVAGYILTCRNMGIKLLPPDINEGQAGFSVTYADAAPAARAGNAQAAGTSSVQNATQVAGIGSAQSAAQAANSANGSAQNAAQAAGTSSVQNASQAAGTSSAKQPVSNAGLQQPQAPAGAIRYGLTAIKGVGRPVIDALIRERERNGRFRDLQDFLSRMMNADREVNKRVVESFIKAGALDSFGATRKQLMSVYMRIMDDLQNSKKNDMAGQLSLFDFADEEDKQDYIVKMPDIGEYSNEMKLAFEKEVLGIYVSGHPLEEYAGVWKAHISNVISDFLLDEETGAVRVRDGAKTVIGGMITDKKIKYTKNNKVMCFLTVEDMTGTMEVIVFPNTYEQFGSKLTEDGKVFLSGRVSLEDERDGKLICEKVIPFEEVPRKLWIRFNTADDYRAGRDDLRRIVEEHGGRDKVVLFIANPRCRKELPPGQGVRADKALVELLGERFGAANVVVQ